MRRVATIAREMVERDGVEAIAISFLHAYRNPAHERRDAFRRFLDVRALEVRQ